MPLDSKGSVSRTVRFLITDHYRLTTMKIAVLADIHANFVALQAVTEHLEDWRPDRVIVAGDVVNRGPRPAECLRFVQEKQRTSGWLVVRGNHEEYVMTHAEPNAPRSGPRFELHRGSFWTYQQLGYAVSDLEAMPLQINLPAPDGGEVRATHASMLGTREGIYYRTPDVELERKIGLPAPGLFCVGHTHIPLVRSLNGTLVVNAGSVGLPFDRDTHAAYAQLEWRGGTLHGDAPHWHAEIVRLDFDRAQAEHDFYETGFNDATALAQLVLIELREARSQLYEWARQYEPRILSGEMTMRQSVREFLAG